MPHHNRAILADIAIQNLDPKKEYKKVSADGLLVAEEKNSQEKHNPKLDVQEEKEQKEDEKLDEKSNLSSEEDDEKEKKKQKQKLSKVKAKLES